MAPMSIVVPAVPGAIGILAAAPAPARAAPGGLVITVMRKGEEPAPVRTAVMQAGNLRMPTAPPGRPAPAELVLKQKNRSA